MSDSVAAPEHGKEAAMHRSPIAAVNRSASSSFSSESTPAHRAAVNTLWRVVFSSTFIWDRRLRYLNTALCAIALANLAVVVALYETCWSPRTLRFSLTQDCASYQWAQAASCGLFVAFIIVLIWYYREKSGYKAFVSHFPSRWSAFKHSGLMSSFAWEACAALVQPFPLLFLFFDLTNAQYLVILALVARLYLFIRLLRDYSEVYQKRLYIKQNTGYDKSWYTMDYVTVAKVYAYHHTALMLVIGCALNALAMAYLLHLCEREYWLPSTPGLVPIRFRDMRDPDQVYHGSTEAGVNEGNNDFALQYRGDVYVQSPFVSMVNSLYFIGVVATTTGLGDISPVTDQGKFFAVCASIMGIVWSSFVVAVFTNKLVPSHLQAHVIDYLARASIDREKQHFAARIIQKRWRLYREYRRLTTRGVYIDPVRKAHRIIEIMTPLYRQFQSAQRKEMHQHYINDKEPFGNHHFNVDHDAHHNDTLDQPRFNQPGNASLARNIQDASAEAPRPRASSSDPLTSYGASDSTSEYGSTYQTTRSLLPESHTVRVRRESSGSRDLQKEISAQGAIKALHNLNRQGSQSGQLNRRGSSASASDLASLHAYVARMESKLDQLLQRNVTDTLATGTVFLSWSLPASSESDSSHGPASAAQSVSTPIFVWHEVDGASKYGSLYWTNEEFAVQNRLRVKQEGHSMPLVAITDVFLGKTTPELAHTSLPSSLCFSLLTAGSSLHLSASSSEQRDHWIASFKRAFVGRRSRGSGSGSISLGTSRSHTPDPTPHSPPPRLPDTPQPSSQKTPVRLSAR